MTTGLVSLLRERNSLLGSGACGEASRPGGARPAERGRAADPPGPGRGGGLPPGQPDTPPPPQNSLAPLPHLCYAVPLHTPE